MGNPLLSENSAHQWSDLKAAELVHEGPQRQGQQCIFDRHIKMKGRQRKYPRIAVEAQHLIMIEKIIEKTFVADHYAFGQCGRA